MSVINMGGLPLIAVGQVSRPDSIAGSPAQTALTALATANAADIFVGNIFWEDGASHTVSTAGSSSIGWKTNTITFNNAATRLVVGLAAVDTSNGPPARAANSAGVITFDVSKTYSTSLGASTWVESVPDSGTKTVAHGDLVAFAVQMTVRGGADSVVVVSTSGQIGGVLPEVTTFDGTSTYTASSSFPCAVLTASDGTLGFFFGSQVAITAATTQTWNSSSSPNEYGNYFLIPFPCSILGIYANANMTGDCSFKLYSDPLGTPVAQRTVTIDGNTIGAASNGRFGAFMFSSAYSVAANAPVAAIITPGASNTSVIYSTFSASAHQKSLPFGTNGYAVNRASGAFAAQNSNKDRFAIGLLVGAFDSGASGPVGHFISAQRGTPY